ncbi:alpha-xenorhabdolysin family binary toxin subunit A [Pseudomonas sp. 10S4]|uniref:alpha-xenorhabdolysin family binary toxin subunit A n=1 Tax=Pseudomonas sp. 10S4 TaxID=3048583 RepID=UPI002AC963DB|nr:MULTISPECIES: alpha-xenorhabdolysin family binary toxin subunit A [unclassified Pseudomonas]MEB0223132.1 alpha-xenorhabdolysin family binary toxin subunit A [Pseudomonas sp. 5S1]MEB0293098.1 alpha-xenorhabdolysin family binary toxin subunit A [Pseudomonas sp. 10S4]WPX20713.1 alpha-xenorhabdolysin family binary toxin subunit A [Pseudomonas sp. 10S4]
MQMSNNTSTPIITKDDIRKIKHYIATAKALPTTIEEVEQQLRTKKTNIVGLEPYDVVSLYHKIINNANSWRDIESSMKRVGGSLSAFSEDLESFGQDIIDAIVTMPGYQNYTGTIKDMSEEEINSLPPLEIGKTEKNRFGSIKDSLTFIASSIDDKKLSSMDVLARLKYFKVELSEEVHMGIGSKLKLASNEEINRQITQLNQKIDETQKRIDEKTRETSPNFFDHVMGFINPLGSLHHRLVADMQKVQLSPLIREREQLTETIKQKNILAGTLLELHSELDSLITYVEGAITSTAQLETLWISTSEYINSSRNKVTGINDFLTLRSFVSSLKVILKNWKSIQNNANALVTAFD